MASPFHVFRKFQKPMMVAITLMAILAFVFLDSWQGSTGASGGDTNPVIATSAFDTFHASDVQYMRDQRTMVMRFIGQVMQYRMLAAMKSGGQENFFARFQVQRAYEELAQRIGPSTTRSVIETRILAEEAQRAGMVISDDAITDFLNEISANAVTAKEFEEALKSLRLPNGQVAPRSMLYAALRNELLALRYRDQFTGSIAPAQASPAQRWDYYLRLKRRAHIEFAPIAAADVVDTIADPKESVLTAFFEAHKNVEPVPGSPDPGFKIPHKAAFEYFRADYESYFDPKSVPADEVLAYYDKHKDPQFLYSDTDGRSLTEPEETPAEQTPAAPSATPKTDEKKPDNNKEPEKKEPEKKTPEGKEPEKKDDVGKKEGDKPEAKPDAPPTDAPKKNEPKPEPTKSEDAKPETPAPKPEAKPDAKPDEPESKQDDKDESLNECGDQEPPKEETPKPVTPPAAAEPAKAVELPKAVDPPKPVTPATPVDPAPAVTPATPATPETKPAAEPPPPLPEQFMLPTDVRQGAKPQFDPLWKVEESIRKTIAGEKAVAALGKPLQTLREKMQEFSLKLGSWEMRVEREPNAPKPEPLDFASLAQAAGLTAHKTPLMPQYEADQLPGLGQSNVDGVRFAIFAFRNLKLYQPVDSQDTDGNRFLSWKIEDQPARVPTLADKAIREEVVRAWKMVQAREKILEQAKAIAAKANAAPGALKDALAKEPALKVSEAGPFSWLTTGSAGGFPNQRAEPRLSEVEGIVDPDESFMRAVFNLDVGQTGVALNRPKTIAYVVRVTSLEPSRELLRETFFADRYETYANAGFSDSRAIYQAWLQNRLDAAKLKWVIEPDDEEEASAG